MINRIPEYTQMVGLYQDPQGEKVFEKSRSSGTQLGNHTVNIGSTDTEQLRRRVRELETMVAKQQVSGTEKTTPFREVFCLKATVMSQPQQNGTSSPQDNHFSNAGTEPNDPANHVSQQQLMNGDLPWPERTIWDSAPEQPVTTNTEC